MQPVLPIGERKNSIGPARCCRIDTLVLMGGVVFAAERRKVKGFGLAVEGSLARNPGFATIDPAHGRELWLRCGFEPGASQRSCGCAL